MSIKKQSNPYSHASTGQQQNNWNTNPTSMNGKSIQSFSTVLYVNVCTCSIHIKNVFNWSFHKLKQPFDMRFAMPISSESRFFQQPLASSVDLILCVAYLIFDSHFSTYRVVCVWAEKWRFVLMEHEEDYTFWANKLILWKNNYAHTQNNGSAPVSCMTTMV